MTHGLFGYLETLVRHSDLFVQRLMSGYNSQEPVWLVTHLPPLYSTVDHYIGYNYRLKANCNTLPGSIHHSNDKLLMPSGKQNCRCLWLSCGGGNPGGLLSSSTT